MNQRHPYAKKYLVAYTIVLVLTLIPQLIQDQETLFLAINSNHNRLLDTFFYLITYFGDGLAYVALIVILLFYSFGKALNGLIIFLSTALIAQVLKRFLFADRIRPFGMLSEQYQLHIPEGVSPIVSLSFPSGHTVTAFAMATFLVLVYPKLKLWFPLLLLAILTAYSRIYLTHHFPIDVWAGSLIGTTGALAMYYLLGQKIEDKFGHKSLLNR